MQLIYGSKAGQKKPHTPRISDDTVASITKITALYLLGEGEIRGLVNGSKSIYFEDTPLEDENGHRNFENVEWEIRHGTVDQTHIPGVPSASTEQIINTELRSGTPWTRLISDTQLSSINVNVSWPRLSKMEDNGDVNGTTVDYAIDVRTDGGAWVTMVSKSLTAKTSGRYQRTHNIPLPDANNNWQVRVRKITEDGDNERLFNQMYIDSIAEIIDAKLCYPHSAVIKLTWDSRAFGNTPKVSFETYGRYVKVPVNYDAETRKSTGIWTGEFKEAFTTNPAWIYYDLITNDRYGLGNKLKPYMINKWAIEHIAKICDVMVDDGKGGLEPRYTCNLYLQTAETAFDVLQHIAGIFRGMAFWNGSQIILDADTYKDCDYVITRANVINGEFVKTGTAANERHTIAKVGYSNPDNNYEVDYVFVRNERAIAEIGINILDLSAIACTSEGEAYRFGLAALLTEQNRTQTVSFTMGLDGALPSVGDRIDIPDIMFTGHNTGGRISGVNKDRTVITVDRDNVPVAAGDKLVVNLESGKAQTREILSINGREITVSKPFDAVSRENVWAVSSDELPTMSFIVLSVRANEDGTQYSYTALQYDATLQQQIDNGTIIENKPPLPPLMSMIIDAPQSITLSTRHRIEQAQTITTLVITWEQVKEAVAYDVEWRKDDGDWISVPRTGNISVEIDGVYSGNYIARVRAISAFDAVSKPATSTLTKVEGKAGKPPSLLSLKATGALFGMELTWSFASGSGDAAYTEIQVASAPDTNVALLGQYSYPTNNAKFNGLQNGLVQYYRGRIVDKLGFKGDWSGWVKGEVLNDSSQVLDLIAGDIEQSHLNQALGQKIDKIDVINQDLSQEVIDRTEAINQTKQLIESETSERIDAINEQARLTQAEREARIEAIQQSAQKQQQALQQAAEGLSQNITQVNNQIDAEQQARINAVASLQSGVNTERQQRQDADSSLSSRIDSVVTKSNDNTAAIAAEVTARTSQDEALASQVSTTLAKVNDNTSAISTEQTARANADSAITRRVDSVVAKADNNTAAIQAEAQTRLESDTALSSQINTVSSTVDANKAQVQSQIQTLTDKDTAQTSQLNYLSSEIDLRYADKNRYASKSAKSWNLAKTIVSGDYANAEQIRGVSAQLDSAKAIFTEQIRTNVTKTEAVTQQITDLSAQMVGGYTGNDLNQVTSGLLHQERQARTTAYEGLVEQISLLSAGVGEQFDPFEIWHFNNDAENWTGGTYNSGYINARTNKLQSPAVSINGNAYHHIKLRVEKVGSPTWSGLVEWAGGNATISEPMFVDNIGLADLNVTWSGVISSFSIKVAQSADNLNYYKVDWMAVGRPSPGASYSALLDEQRTRASADEALTQSIQQLNSDLNTKTSQLSSAINQQLQTITDQQSTQAEQLNQLSSNISTVDSSLSSRITQLNNTLSNEQSSQATQINELSAQIDLRYADKNRYASKNRSIQRTTAIALVQADYAQNQRITEIQSDFANSTASIFESLTTLSAKDSALAESLSNLSTSVDSNASSINARLQTLSNDSSSQASQLTQLSAQSQATKNRAENAHERIDTTNQQLDSAKSAITKNSAAIQSESQVRSGEDAALSSRIDIMSSTVGNNTAAIQAEQKARANADSALSQQINTVQSSTATAQATAERAIADAQSKAAAAEKAAKDYALAQAKAEADAAKAAASSDASDKAAAAESAAKEAAALDAKNKADAALAAAKDDATTKANAAKDLANAAQNAANAAATAAGNKGEIIYQSQTPAASKRLAQNLWIDTTGGKNTPKRWDGSSWVAVTDKAAIDAQNAANEAQSTADEALGKANTATSNIATIKTELTATTSKTNATANQVTTIQTTVNGHTSSIQTQQTSINGLSAQSVLTLDVNGYITGVGSYNDGKKGSFAIRADEFWIASPDNKSKVRPLVYYPSSTTINGVTVPSGLYLDGNLLATGTITGDKIRANTEINAPVIKGGQININDKFIVDSLGNVTAKNGTFEGDVRLKNGQVDTLQIAGNAITTSRVQYTENSVTTVGTNPIEINSVTIDSAGGSVAISCNFENIYVADASSGDSVTIKVWRSGLSTPLRSVVFKSLSEVAGTEEYEYGSANNTNWRTRLVWRHYLSYQFLTIANFIDYPPNGEVRYYITAEATGTRSLTISGRSLTLFGAKR